MTIYEQATQSPRDFAAILHKIYPKCSACPVVAECMYNSGHDLLTCVDRLENYVIGENI